MISAETYNQSGFYHYDYVTGEVKTFYSDMSNRDLQNSVFNSCSVVNFSNSNLSGSKFYEAFYGNNYTNANCSGVVFSGKMKNYQSSTTLPTVIFFTGTNLQNTSFVDITEYWISGRVYAEFADFRGSNSGMLYANTLHNTISDTGYIMRFWMTSSADDFYIRKYTPATVGGATISAKFAENASVSGDATLTLEQGAEVEVIGTAVLSFGAESTLAINTDINGTSAFSIGDNAGITFEDGATVSVNLEGVFDSSLPYVFSILNWGDNSNVEGLLNLVKGDTLLLLINGVLFSGEWDCAITNNALQISMNVPEPATYAAVFGALALALAVARRRR